MRLLTSLKDMEKEWNPPQSKQWRDCVVWIQSSWRHVSSAPPKLPPCYTPPLTSHHLCFRNSIKMVLSCRYGRLVLLEISNCELCLWWWPFCSFCFLFDANDFSKGCWFVSHTNYSSGYFFFFPSPCDVAVFGWRDLVLQSIVRDNMSLSSSHFSLSQMNPTTS